MKSVRSASFSDLDAAREISRRLAGEKSQSPRPSPSYIRFQIPPTEAAAPAVGLTPAQETPPRPEELGTGPVSRTAGSKLEARLVEALARTLKPRA